MLTLEVKCINKGNRFSVHEHIMNIGVVAPDGSYRKYSQTKVISMIESYEAIFYVKKNGHLVWLKVAVSQYGHKYVKTEADGDRADNLLSLYECVA